MVPQQNFGKRLRNFSPRPIARAYLKGLLNFQGGFAIFELPITVGVSFFPLVYPKSYGDTHRWT